MSAIVPPPAPSAQPPTPSSRKPISARLRYDVLRRCNFACYYCGVPAARGMVELHVDHVIPVSLGGTNDPWNLVAACVPCNLGKANLAPTTEVIRSVRREWVDYASPRSRPVILCAHCGIPVILPEGEEAVIQCNPCLEMRIAAYMSGAGA